MSNAKVVMGQAANTLVKPLEVEDVFSTYLYEGNASTQTITNGIDLDGEGGLVWFKNRSAASTNHSIFDTESGATGGKRLRTNLTDGLQVFNGSAVFTTSATGFALNNDASNDLNDSIYNYVSWTFRKAPKFFDVVTWTGNSTSGREIAHNLGSVPGMIIVKSLTEARQWMVYHRSTGNAEATILNSTAASASTALWNSTDPTSTVFTLNNDGDVNTTGNNYVAYLFAHNDGDGGFNGGDIIKCGSYTGNGTYLGGPEIDLGFEPQWLLIKSTGNESWRIADNMRGIAMGTAGAYLSANLDNLEATSFGVELQPTGFKVMSNNADLNSNGQDYIYIAIRRGTKVPESGTEVFATNDVDNGASAPDSLSGFPVDMYFRRYVNTTNDTYLLSRLTGTGALKTNGTDAEASFSTSSAGFDYNNGVMNIFSSNNADFHTWMWKRAPNFFDVVAYTGNSTAGRTVSHNLGVAPEMMIVKKRNSSTNSSWIVYHSGNTAPNTTNAASNFLVLNSTQASLASLAHFNQTMPSSTEFTLGTSTITNASGDTYIAYLFASLPGISKVGSYTGSNDVGSQTIDCGFTSGARFVLIKSYTGIGEWFLFDSLRGITVGSTDPLLQLQSTDPEYTEAAWSGVDMIQPHPSGFTLATSGEVNNYTRSYIFYAIA